MTDAWVKITRGYGEAPRWYSPTLWQTMTATAWWRLLRAHRFRVRAGRLPQAAVITALTATNSALGLIQSALFGARLGKVPIDPDPIFVIGHYRSGTTHLHNLLAQDERLSFPTMFECLAPHHCLLTGRLYPKLFSSLLPDKRSMDDMALGFGLPQEDELALVALGAPSPYWSLAYPGEAVGRRFLGLTGVTEQERGAWEKVLTSFLRLVNLRCPGKPIVLKSPPHTARLAVLTSLFPNARFLHIVRDPVDTFASTVHLWRTTRAANALIAYEDTAIERDVLEGLPEMYRDFEKARAALSPGRFYQLRYEDLLRDPLRTLSACYEAIDLGEFATVRPRLERYLAGLSGYRANQYQVSPEGRAAVRVAWGPLFRTWGYEMA
jgi:hypothetical protein